MKSKKSKKKSSTPYTNPASKKSKLNTSVTQTKVTQIDDELSQILSILNPPKKLAYAEEEHRKKVEIDQCKYEQVSLDFEEAMSKFSNL